MSSAQLSDASFLCALQMIRRKRNSAAAKMVARLALMP